MGAKTKNAVAGVGARNGVKKMVQGDQTEFRSRTERPPLARHLVALIDRDGTVAAVFRRPDEVRAFLQGGRA